MEIVERLRRKVRSVQKQRALKRHRKWVDHAPRDARIAYPCYKSFDEIIDVERLKSLDACITEGIRKYVAAGQEEKFYTGTATLDADAPRHPGSRVIHLTQSTKASTNTDDYYDLDVAELWTKADDAKLFPELMAFIDTLPFKKTARMLIMYDDSGRAVPAHRDHTTLRFCHEFIWFRTNFVKPFYMLNHMTQEKRYVESSSAWFDTANQFHGVDAGRPALSFSIRVDGTFSDELRARIPVPAFNRASTPALWASIGDKT